MFVVANFITALAHVLSFILEIVWWLILIRALVSWVNPDPYNPIVQFLYKTTEPILAPLRRLLPLYLRSGIDISPVIAILIIVFLKSFLVPSLIGFAVRLQ